MQDYLENWNNTRKDYPRDRCIHELFEEQVARTPDAIALLSSEQQVTYAELNRAANRLAHTLQSFGVHARARVGLFAHRSVDAIIGILAILKAGSAYVPLDPEYPAERLEFLLGDTNPVVLLTHRELAGRLPKHNANVVFLHQSEENSKIENETNRASGTTAEDLCYIMYTSGSTGKPKGVCIPHRGVVRLVKETNYVRLTADERLLQISSISFDVSNFEIWGALLNGGSLVIPEAGKLSVMEIGDLLQKYHVTTIWLTSGLFYEMVEFNLESLKGLRQLVAGGDVVPVSSAKRILRELPHCQLINGYGPTENSTFSCCFPVPASFVLEKSVPIGRPIANSSAYILDSQMQPVPIGEAGEIYVGGDGLALGYLNRPDLTAQKFIPNPFVQDGSRLYKTGDLGRWLPEGIIEFLGRMDNQIKIRGFRVEPGEIEAALAEHPAVRNAIVVSWQNKIGNDQLVAYLVCREKSMNMSMELKEFLIRKLPDYMIPSQFVFLDVFPLTANGKIDRSALPKPPDTRDPGGSGFVAARTSLEESIQAIWLEVLGTQEIGINDDFFLIGGDSLLATRVVSRLRKTLEVDLPLHVFFEQSTIAALARVIQEYQTARN